MCFCPAAQVCPMGLMQTCSPFPSRDLPLSPSHTMRGPGEQVRLKYKTRRTHCTSVYYSFLTLFLSFPALPLFSLGTSPSLSPVTSPSHSPPTVGTGSSSSLVPRLPVEFPDTADFLTKPSVNLNLHKPLGYTVNSPDFRSSALPLCTR